MKRQISGGRERYLEVEVDAVAAPSPEKAGKSLPNHKMTSRQTDITSFTHSISPAPSMSSVSSISLVSSMSTVSSMLSLVQ